MLGITELFLRLTKIFFIRKIQSAYSFRAIKFLWDMYLRILVLLSLFSCKLFQISFLFGLPNFNRAQWCNRPIWV